MGILASILESMLTESPTINKIMMKSNLNGREARGGLDRLNSAGLLTKSGGPSNRLVYAATHDGIRWLRSYRDLEKRVGLNPS